MQSRVNFGVAAAAQEDTLLHLVEKLLPTSQQSTLADVKYFLLGIAVVEGVRSRAVSTIATNLAASTRQRHKVLFSPPAHPPLIPTEL
jgi:hypothetical protein